MKTSPTTSVLDEATTWPGISTQLTPRGSTAIMIDGHELGHVHPDRGTLDMPLSPDRRADVLQSGRAKEWFSGWVSKPLKNVADAQDAIALLRGSYDEVCPGEQSAAPEADRVALGGLHRGPSTQ